MPGARAVSAAERLATYSVALVAAAAEIRPITRDEADTGVRGLARTVTHLGALLCGRLALLT